jgi:hypothetical protein
MNLYIRFALELLFEFSENVQFVLSLPVCSAIARPPLLHTELSLPPASGDINDQALGGLTLLWYHKKVTLTVPWGHIDPIKKTE